MIKGITIILFGLILFQNINAQQPLFGCKSFDNNDILSNVFLIHDGFVLDSLRDSFYKITYKYEYDNNGKLIRDINHIGFSEYTIYGEAIRIPGARDYYYNNLGQIDSILYGKWNDTLNIFKLTGTKLKYIYDNKSNLTSINYLYKDTLNYVLEYTYDENGNLILSKAIKLSTPYFIQQDTTSYVIREYDSQNRLLLKKDINMSYDSSYTQKVYDYDSLGNINCLSQHSIYNGIRNDMNNYYKFDVLDRLSSEVISTEYYDTTWNHNSERFYNYDANGRIIKIGNDTYFSYNAESNVDSIWTYLSGFGYFNSAILIDSYGNNVSINLPRSKIYFYYSKLITEVEHTTIVNNFRLFQNYPNPFNPITKINYILDNKSFVKLELFDLLGRKVRTLVNEYKSIGSYTYKLDMSNFPSGVYIYMLNNGNNSISKKMIYLK
jgi:hypothetical protein